MFPLVRSHIRTRIEMYIYNKINLPEYWFKTFPCIFCLITLYMNQGKKKSILDILSFEAKNLKHKVILLSLC